jgi:hypothetical protein
MATSAPTCWWAGSERAGRVSTKNVGTRAAPKFDRFSWFQAGSGIAEIEAGWCIGFGPRLADFDNDGVKDVVSGSYAGGLSFFKGLGGGKCAAEKKFTDKDGKPLSDEFAESACLGDWDGDGDWDVAELRVM